MAADAIPMSDDVRRINAQIAAHGAVVEPPLSVEERAHRFVLVCRTAASLEAGRRAAGLPEPLPAPWPESTWQFLAEQTRRARAGI
jgi:hypothetical protein